MKQLTNVLFSSLLAISLAPMAMAAKGRTTRRMAAPAGNGGVILSTPNPRSALDHNNRAVELGTKGIWPDAIREHELALSMEPSNKEYRTNLSAAHLNYGKILMGRGGPGNIYAAINQFHGALFVDPDNMPADEFLDECYKKVGKNPLDSKFRAAHAEELETSGHFEDAIVEYRKLTRMIDSGKAHADLGYCLLKADKPVDGYQELCIAVQKTWANDERDQLAAVHRKLGEVLKEFAYKAKDRGAGTVGMKRLLNAGTEYRRAVTLNPKDADAIQGLIEVSREAVAMVPSFDNHLMLGGAYLLASDFAHAKIEYEQCYKIDPRRTELGPARIAFHQAVGRSPLSSDEMIAESVTKAQKALQDDPDNARWWYILGLLKQRQGDNNGALEAYYRAEKINRLIDPDLENQIRVLAGGNAQGGTAVASNPFAGGGAGHPQAGSPGGNTAAATQGAPGKPMLDPRNMQAYAEIESNLSSNPDHAMQIVDGLLEKNPADGHAWKLKGAVLQKKNQLDEAAAAFRQAAAFKEPDADDELRMVNTIRVQDNVSKADQYIQQSNYVKAADELGDAIIKAPNLPALHRKLADVLRHMNDSKAADKELAKADSLEKAK